MTVLVIRKGIEKYPFTFLSEERYSTEEAFQLICEMYEWIAREGPMEIMSIYHLIHSTINVFIKEKYARMIIHGDYEENEFSFHASGNEICDYFYQLSEDEGMSLEEFLDKLSEETSSSFSTNETYFKNFHYDVRYALGYLGLTYYDIDGSVESYRYFQKEDALPVSAFLKNSVVKEVW
jgi:hypothetical protein